MDTTSARLPPQLTTPSGPRTTNRMEALLLSIGDELTLGQTVNTNSAWLAQQLAAVGYRPVAHLTVPDDQAPIRHAFEPPATPNPPGLPQQLAAVGSRPVAHLPVPDDQAAIRQAFEESVGRCDALIV